MATRYGHSTLVWLEKRGWAPAPLPKKMVYGDQHVIDPQTNEEKSDCISHITHKREQKENVTRRT